MYNGFDVWLVVIIGIYVYISVLCHKLHNIVQYWDKCSWSSLVLLWHALLWNVFSFPKSSSFISVLCNILQGKGSVEHVSLQLPWAIKWFLWSTKIRSHSYASKITGPMLQSSLCSPNLLALWQSPITSFMTFVLGFMFTASQTLDGMKKTLHSIFHCQPLFTGFGCSINYALKINDFLSIMLILPKFKCPKGFFLTGW